VAAAEWRSVELGLAQRVWALNAFLGDIYQDQRCVTDGVIPAAILFEEAGFVLRMVGFTPPLGVYIHISGSDLIRDQQGQFRVLEDNVRTPSGVSYALENRRVILNAVPDLFESAVAPVSDYPEWLLDMLIDVRPDNVGRDEAPAVVLTLGAYNSAYFEHSFLAQQMGIPLVEGRDLIVHDNQVYLRETTGLGFALDDRGEMVAGVVDLLEGVFANWHRQVLVQAALPDLDGVVERLTAGGLGADVGCGSGIAVLEMAQAFPLSVFHGYDNSRAMLSAAAGNLAAADIDNANFYNVDDQVLPDSAQYDFVLTFDCLHDMPYPDQMAVAIRTAIKLDGVWFIADIDGNGTFEDNLRDHPRAATAYSTSIFACLVSSMCDPDSVGYGRLGLSEPVMKRLVEEADFSRFRRVRPEVSGLALGGGPALFEARP
jgi:SAM-dependent methyltransferase